MKPSREEIRRTGVVYTPIEVADEICRLALRCLSGKARSVLEPSAGDGIFLNALIKSGLSESEITAVDIDPKAIEYLGVNYENVKIIKSDYLEFVLGDGLGEYDLIIGNPPYIRRHNYNDNFSGLVTKLSNKTGFSVSHLKNAWSAFSLASINLLSDRGTLAFIVPYELITVKYGRALQAELAKKFRRVDIYVPDEKAFKKIDQDAVVFIATNSNVAKKSGLFIHRVKNLADMTPVSSKSISLSTTKNISTDLKAFLLEPDTVELLHKIRADLKPISSYCDSVAGIVTAANDFFILNKEEVEKLELMPWARKILKKGSYLSKSPNFTEQDFDLLETEQPCYLIDFSQSNINDLSEAAHKYIKHGEELGLHERYKCRRRSPWFKVPIVPVSEGFFFKRSHKLPRLSLNEARVLVTDTAYQVRMKDGYEIQDLSYSFYNSLTLLFSEIDGRFYGGGVLELTPLEFRGLPIFYQTTTESEYNGFVERFTNMDKPCFSFEDNKLRQNMKLSVGEMKKIQNALSVVQGHRLRHGT